MNRRSISLGATLGASTFAALLAMSVSPSSDASASACLPTDRIDGSTAAEAAKTMEAFGYLKPHDLKKGCDNYWYARAANDGATVDVVLPPGGKPFTAHDS